MHDPSTPPVRLAGPPRERRTFAEWREWLRGGRPIGAPALDGRPRLAAPSPAAVRARARLAAGAVALRAWHLTRAA